MKNKFCSNCLRHYDVNGKLHCQLKGQLNKSDVYEGKYDNCEEYLDRDTQNVISTKELMSYIPCYIYDDYGEEHSISDSNAVTISKNICKAFFQWQSVVRPPEQGYCIIRTLINNAYRYEIGFFSHKTKSWFALTEKGKWHIATPSEWRPIIYDVIL